MKCLAIQNKYIIFAILFTLKIYHYECERKSTGVK